MPPVTSVNPIRAGQARRDGAADRRRQPQAGADRARLPALRPRQGDRAADPGLVALADGRRRSPVTDTTHATFWRRLVRWLVDGVPEQVNVSTTRRPRRAGRADQADGRGARRRVRRGQRRRVVAHVTVAVGQDDRGAGRVDGRPRTASTARRSCRTSRALRRQGRPRRAIRRTLGTADMHVRVVGRRRRVLRRGDARAAAQADRRGDRRPLLHARQRGVAARSHQLQRPRRHRRRRARAVGHAGALPRCSSG